MSEHTNKMLPIFSVENYDIWKFRMEAHLGSIHDEMWDVMENGPIIVTWPNTTLGGDPTQPIGVQVPKPSRKFTYEKRQRANLDQVANNILQHSVGDANYLGRIRMCKTTKEIWETLILMCEGTDKIKENGLSIAIQKYEKFEMLSGKNAQLDV
ncbi:hypothetical protein ACS0TY_013320 [Phlomoides rotata]